MDNGLGWVGLVDIYCLQPCHILHCHVPHPAGHRCRARNGYTNIDSPNPHAGNDCGTHLIAGNSNPAECGYPADSTPTQSNFNPGCAASDFHLYLYSHLYLYLYIYIYIYFYPHPYPRPQPYADAFA